MSSSSFSFCSSCQREHGVVHVCVCTRVCVLRGRGWERHAIWLPKSHFAPPPILCKCATEAFCLNSLHSLKFFEVWNTLCAPSRADREEEGGTMRNLAQDAGHLFRLSYKLCATINQGNDGQPANRLSVTAFQLLWIGKAMTFCKNRIILDPNYGFWAKISAHHSLFQKVL